MGTAKCSGRVGALAVALGVGIAVANTPGVAFAEPADAPSDRTALVMGTSGIPTPDDFWVESVKKQFIASTLPRQDIEYVKVTTAEEVWPFTGVSASSASRPGPRTSAAPMALPGQTSRYGNSRGSSTSPSINRSRPGSPIWKRRWPRTATTIW